MELVGSEVAVYTDEERSFYVARMWSEGLTPFRAERLWGRPTRESLRSWEKLALSGELRVEVPDRPGACEHAKHARYPEETKAEALRLLALGKPTREIARALGLPSGSVVSRWARSARERAKMGPEATRVKQKKKKQGDAPAADAAELERLRLENAVLREMVSDPKAGDPASLSNRRKAELGERLRRDYGFRLSRVLAFLRISKSSYEYERSALARPERGCQPGLADRVERAFAFLRGMCGYRKVAACIRSGADGEPPAAAPERKVREAMRERGLRPRRARPRRPFSSYAGEVDGRPANLPRERAEARRAAGEDFRLAHDFSAAAPGELLVTDVTEFSLNGFKTYLSPVLDCWDGCPVGFSVSRHPDQELCSSSLAEALGNLPEGSAPVAHTDGGGCYRSGAWKGLCAAAGVTRSMSRKAACPDNARAEGFFGTLKQEWFYGREWAGVGYGAFAAGLAGYVDWYVNGRPKLFEEGGARFYETPAEHRRRHGYPVPRFAACAQES